MHQRLWHILDRREPTHRIAIERRIARRDLALIPRRQDQPAMLIRQTHQEHATDASLQVLCRQPLQLGQRLVEIQTQIFDRQLAKIDPEILGHNLRIRPRLRNVKPRRHRHAMHALGA